MSVINHMGKRRMAVVGFGVAAVSLFGGIAPAVAAAAPSRVTLSTSTPSVGIGGTAKLKAVVKPVTGTLKPTGTVTFREGATSMGTVTLVLVGTVQTAKLQITTLPQGSHTFIATYNGSVDYATSVSLPVIIVVGKSTTTTSTTSSTPSPLPGQDTKIKAVVKPAAGSDKPTGSVIFTEGATTYDTVALDLVGTSETAKLTIPGLSLGTHVITGTYSGSSTFAASTSSVTVTVTKGSTTSTITATPDAVTPGKYTVVVAVKAVLPARGIATGLVTFIVDSNAPQVFTLNATGKAQFNITFVVGSSHTVRVTYGGDPGFLGSSGVLTFTA